MWERKEESGGEEGIEKCHFCVSCTDASGRRLAHPFGSESYITHAQRERNRETQGQSGEPNDTKASMIWQEVLVVGYADMTSGHEAEPLSLRANTCDSTM